MIEEMLFPFVHGLISPEMWETLLLHTDGYAAGDIVIFKNKVKTMQEEKLNFATPFKKIFKNCLEEIDSEKSTN